MPAIMAQPSRLCRQIAAAEIVIVILVAPVLLFPSPTRLTAALLVPLVWICAWRTTGRLIPSTPLNASLLVLLAMVGVSLFATFDVRYSLGKVSGVMLGVVLFWAVTRWMVNRERLAIGVAAFILSGGVLAAIGLVGTNWFDKFSAVGGIVQRLPKIIRGLPGAEEGFQPNAIAGCLVLYVPLQFALLANRGESTIAGARGSSGGRTSLVALQVVLVGLTMGTLLLTQSRGAWTGLLAGAAAFLMWYGERSRLVAVAGMAVVIVLAIAMGPARLVDLAITNSGPGMAGNVSSRTELWSSAVEGIEDFPLTGMGMNGFRKIVPALYPTSLTARGIDISHAHNHLLQAALDLGILGLVAYGSIWMTAAALLIMVYRRSREPVYRTIAGGLGAGLLAHFVFSMTDAIALGAKVGILFWLTLALTAALHAVALPVFAADVGCTDLH